MLRNTTLVEENHSNSSCNLLTYTSHVLFFLKAVLQTKNGTDKLILFRF